MATRRNRIVVKPNLKPAAPKSSSASTIQKTKTPVSTLQATSESASTTGKHTVTPAPSEKSVTQVTSETEKRKGIEKGPVELQSGGDFDGGPESVPVKQKLNAHLLKKSVISNLTEEFAKENEGLDKLTDGSISVCSGVKETAITDNTNAVHGKKESSVVSKENEIHKEIESQPAAVDSTISQSLNYRDIPATDICVVDKPDTTSARNSQDDTDQADTQIASNKPGDVSADVREPTTDEVASQPKVQRKKREKKERKDPLPPSDKSPDRHKMRMSDLIVWNPAQNYFPKKKKANNNPPVKKEERPKTPESIISMDDESSNQSNSLPAPRVMIGPDGNIVLDTQSLIIETPKDDTEAKTIIEEDDDDRYLNSNSYRKTSKTKIWTEKENEKFFIGLSMCGTDFSLMCNLLPKRTRRELKNKFRREEKRNRFLIDKALSSRQPYDMTPFKRMEEEETAKLKEALQVKKEVKRKCKEEAKEERLKKIKKEKRRAKKRKAKESEDEEDDWGDEPEYDDDYYEEEENQSEENDDENNIESNASAARPKKRKLAQNKRSQSQSVININSATPPNPRRVFTPIDEAVNQPFVPPGMSAPYIPTVIEAIDDENENSRLISNQPSTLLPSAVQSPMPYHPHNLQSAANNTSTPVPRHIGASSNNTAGLSQGEMAAIGLRSIPGTAPIQIEMEGVTNPMQGVLIPSHLVPQLAPQLGIPASSTPMQVLLVQEEGRTGGNMVHVYVLPEKESSPFPQVGQGRVASDGSGRGLTLTSPIASPHPPSRRPSSSSIPTPASPFSPPPLGQQSSLAH